jgi:hypothetical protein
MRALSVQLAELAEVLHELRRRLRQTARVEVARAIGEALRELTLVVICGPGRFGPTRDPYSSWDDPWQDAAADGWHAQGPYPEDVALGDSEPSSKLTVPAALVAGLGAARWGYVRTRQPALALLIGVAAACAAHAGGPTMQALLDSWSTANEILSFPDPRP